MRSLGWIVVAVALAGTCAFAADEEQASPSKSKWLSHPSSEDFSAAYAKVVKPGSFYRTAITCKVGDDGELDSCRVLLETPAGSGFGAAILALTPKYQRRPPGPRDPREVTIVDDWSGADTFTDWRKKPSAEDIVAVFPKDAYRRGISGKASINCVVTVQGALSDCLVLEETPVGAGFGAAAIALTPQFLMKPAQSKGVPTQTTATIPVNFKMDGRGGDTVGSRKVVNATLAWATAPTFSAVAAAYPEKARREKRGGHIMLSCDMTDGGRLARCDAAAEEPKGFGFGAAAKSLAAQFSFAVATEADRKATRGLEVHLPVTFDPAMLEQAPPVIGKPVWSKLPQGEQVKAAFAEVKVTGTARARLECTVQPGGGLDDCRVVSETPADAGVGVAALKLVSDFRVTTWTAEGLPVVGGQVTIPIRYEGGEAAKPAS